MYVTDKCLIMCDNLFYDPCRCPTNGECSNAVFDKDSCTDAEIPVDPRTFVTPQAKLYSMHWPTNDSIKTAILAQNDRGVEGDAPDAFCDDLMDYFDANAQHPVGYHPTVGCTLDDTNMRGFDAWMTTGSDDAGGPYHLSVRLSLVANSMGQDLFEALAVDR